MATEGQIRSLYDWLDLFQELRLRSHADITRAFSDGDFGKTLARAQGDKHKWVLRNLNYRPGYRILNIGCGWGPCSRRSRPKPASPWG
jgi:cyclopropane fatty-acyl-phospholipid synthase-like methyltransferase